MDSVFGPDSSLGIKTAQNKEKILKLFVIVFLKKIRNFVNAEFFPFNQNQDFLLDVRFPVSAALIVTSLLQQRAV